MQAQTNQPITHFDTVVSKASLPKKMSAKRHKTNIKQDIGSTMRQSKIVVINFKGYPADQSTVKFHGKTKKPKLHAFMYE